MLEAFEEVFLIKYFLSLLIIIETEIFNAVHELCIVLRKIFMVKIWP